MTDQLVTISYPVLSPVVDPPFNYLAALYFLDSGHLLYRRPLSGGGYQSKFVSLVDAAAAFTQKDIDTGWLPAGVVRWGTCSEGEYFVYSAPAQKVTLAMTKAGDDPQDLTVPIPRTVLLGVGATYYLWAVQTKVFDPNADAFHAPFPNVYDDGHICWGQNRPGPAAPMSARKVWELFFGSLFNQDLAAGKSQKLDNACTLLRTLHGQKAGKFPNADLVPVNKSIRLLIEHILESR